ncbi:MAG: 50S ribosomal protein L9 [Patescibacteria group bacterium]
MAQVILQKDIASLGSKGDIKKVADGFARNWLIPQKLAFLATGDVINEVKTKKQINKDKMKSQHRKIDSLAKRIEATKMVIKAKANETGRLFGAISASDIVKKIKEDTNSEILESSIDLKEHIKEVGDHDFLIKFPDNITIKAKITVEAA